MFRRAATALYLGAAFVLMIVGLHYLDRLEDWLGCPLDIRCGVTALQKWVSPTPNAPTTPIAQDDNDERERFIAAKRNCVRIQQRYSIERGSGFTDAQLEKFCDCWTPSLLKLLTEQDFKNLASAEPVSADVQEKGRSATRWCERTLPTILE